MGVARCHLAGLEIRDVHHEGIDSDRLASQGIPLVLDLEDPPWEGGRGMIPKDVRELIRTVNRENPIWGAPKIHGELLKLGIESRT